MKPTLTLISGNPAEHLAAHFAILVKRVTTAEQYAEIRRRNKTIAPGCCATHEFFDANEIMLEAFNSQAERDMDLESEADQALWNEAWEIATKTYLS